MAARIRAVAKPELIAWAREDAGLSVEEAARKIQVTPERLDSWERGEAQPTINQLRKLSRVCKRPLAIFFLDKPPKHFQAMKDFRRLPGEVAGVESPQLRVEIRRARYRRQIALELFAALGETPPAFGTTIDLSQDPEAAAASARRLLGLSLEAQTRWRTPYDALNGWRAALEDQGVLVLQATGVPLEEFRGFSISDAPLPTIVVNGKDTPHARIFTMMHELSHLLLHREGLCDLVEEAHRPPEEQRVEVFCNRVAGAVLVPHDQLLAEDVVRENRDTRWSDDDLQTLSTRYRVSREVVLRRLVILGKASEAFYRKKRAEFREQYKARQPRGQAIVTPDRKAVSSAGPLFTRLVLESYYQEKITSSHVSDFLEVRLKHLPKIEKAVLGRMATEAVG